jgi:hypothetical protein
MYNMCDLAGSTYVCALSLKGDTWKRFWNRNETPVSLLATSRTSELPSQST